MKAGSGDAEGPDEIPSDTRVRQVNDPEECVALVTAAFQDDLAMGYREWTFFLAAVDASTRSNRLTLHVEESAAGLAGVTIVIHGSKTSSVWKSTSTSLRDHHQVICGAVMAEATERGVEKVIWPGGIQYARTWLSPHERH